MLRWYGFPFCFSLSYLDECCICRSISATWPFRHSSPSFILIKSSVFPVVSLTDSTHESSSLIRWCCIRGSAIVADRYCPPTLVYDSLAVSPRRVSTSMFALCSLRPYSHCFTLRFVCISRVLSYNKTIFVYGREKFKYRHFTRAYCNTIQCSNFLQTCLIVHNSFKWLRRKLVLISCAIHFFLLITNIFYLPC